MTEKISIFDVEISCIKAKEAMMQAIGFMKDDSVNTIELVSMESLMKEHENPEWKKKVSMHAAVSLTMMITRNGMGRSFVLTL